MLYSSSSGSPSTAKEQKQAIERWETLKVKLQEAGQKLGDTHCVEEDAIEEYNRIKSDLILKRSLPAVLAVEVEAPARWRWQPRKQEKRVKNVTTRKLTKLETTGETGT